MNAETDERQTCSAEHPKPKGAPGRWEHMRTWIVHDWGDTVEVRCIVCGEQWEQEVAR